MVKHPLGWKAVKKNNSVCRRGQDCFVWGWVEKVFIAAQAGKKIEPHKIGGQGNYTEKIKHQKSKGDLWLNGRNPKGNGGGNKSASVLWEEVACSQTCELLVYHRKKGQCRKIWRQLLKGVWQLSRKSDQRGSD